MQQFLKKKAKEALESLKLEDSSKNSPEELRIGINSWTFIKNPEIMKLVKSEDAAESEATIDKIISLAKEDPEIQKIQDYYRKELIKNHGFPESHLDTPQKIFESLDAINNLNEVRQRFNDLKEGIVKNPQKKVWKKLSNNLKIFYSKMKNIKNILN